ncbi:hypothetical protein ACV229_20910 [Burkholderia sp. MR1-5-21]
MLSPLFAFIRLCSSRNVAFHAVRILSPGRLMRWLRTNGPDIQDVSYLAQDFWAGAD